MGQRDHREHYASLPVPVQKRLSSLNFELAIWQRAADQRAAKKKQLAAKKKQQLAGLQQGKQIARNAGANRAIKHGCIVLRKDALELAVLLEWKIMIALAFASASVVSLSCAMWAV